MKSFKCRFPQECILVQLLFIIYLNDVPSQQSKEGTNILYADDTVVSNICNTEIAGIKHDDTVASWFHKNKSTVNTTKIKTHGLWKRTQSKPAQNNNLLSNQYYSTNF